MQNFLPGPSGPSSDWADAIPLMRWSGFIPGLQEAAGMEGLSGPQGRAAKQHLGRSCPVWLHEGFNDLGMGSSLPRARSEVFIISFAFFLDLRRGEKSAIMIPFHPTFIWPRKALRLSNVPSFPLSPVPSHCTCLPARHSNLFTVYLGIQPCSFVLLCGCF